MGALIDSKRLEKQIRMSHPIHLILSAGTRIVARNVTEVNAWRLRLPKEFDGAFASTRLPGRPGYAGTNDVLKAKRVMRELEK